MLARALKGACQDVIYGCIKKQNMVMTKVEYGRGAIHRIRPRQKVSSYKGVKSPPNRVVFPIRRETEHIDWDVRMLIE